MKIRTLKPIDRVTVHDPSRQVTIPATTMPAGRYTVRTTAGGFVWLQRGRETARYLLRLELFRAGLKSAMIRVKEETKNLF